MCRYSQPKKSRVIAPAEFSYWREKGDTVKVRNYQPPKKEGKSEVRRYIVYKIVVSAMEVGQPGLPAGADGLPVAPARATPATSGHCSGFAQTSRSRRFDTAPPQSSPVYYRRAALLAVTLRCTPTLFDSAVSI